MREWTEVERRQIRLGLRWRMHVLWHSMCHHIGGYTAERKWEYDECRKLYQELSDATNI